MAQNWIDLLERLLGSNEVLSRIGALIGLSPGKTEAAIGAAVPAILAGLVGVAQKPEGRNRLAAVIQSQDPGLLDNVTGALSGGREQSLIESGKGMLSSLFGQANLDGLAGALGRSTGLDRNAAGSLLGALAPVVMGTLRREQQSQGLDAQGLAGMLSNQKDNIARALPAGLASALGSTGLLEGVADRLGEGVTTAAQAGRATAAHATRTAGGTTTVSQTTSGGSFPWRWIIGLLILLALLWLAYHYLFRREVEEAVVPTTPPAAQVGEPAQNLVVGDVNLGQEVTGVFESARTAFNDITDAASAQAALPKLTEIDGQLGQLGGLVGQLPAEGKTALAALINAALPELEALITKVSGIPGVGDVIKPAADAIVAKLKAMTA